MLHTSLLVPSIIPVAECQAAFVKYAKSDASVKEKHAELGNKTNHGFFITTYNDEADLLRIDFEPNVNSTNEIIRERAYAFRVRLKRRNGSFRLQFNVNTGDIQFDVCDGPRDKRPLMLLPAGTRLCGVFQPHTWGQCGIGSPPYWLHMREDGGCLMLFMMKAVMGHQAVIFTNNDQIGGGILADDETRAQVLVLNFSNDEEDIMVANTMVDTLRVGEITSANSFVHIEHVDPAELASIVAGWDKNPWKIEFIPSYLRSWHGKLTASRDAAKNHDKMSAAAVSIYVPPVVFIIAHGSADSSTLHTSRRDDRDITQSIITYIELLLHTHIPPHVFALCVCFGGGASSSISSSLSSTSSALVSRLAKLFYPIPFVAYTGELTFADLLLGHPFVLVHVLLMLFRPVRTVSNAFEMRIHKYMTNHSASPIIAAFRVAAFMSDSRSTSRSRAMLYNDVDPYQAVDRPKLWGLCKSHNKECKMSWYTIISANANIVKVPSKSPVQYASLGIVLDASTSSAIDEVNNKIYQQLGMIKCEQGDTLFLRATNDVLVDPTSLFRSALAAYQQASMFANTHIWDGVSLALQSYFKQFACMHKLGMPISSLRPLESCLTLIAMNPEFATDTRAHSALAYAMIRHTLMLQCEVASIDDNRIRVDTIVAALRDRVVDAAADGIVDHMSALRDTLGREMDALKSCIDECKGSLSAVQRAAFDTLIKYLPADHCFPNKLFEVVISGVKKQGHHVINAGVVDFHSDIFKRLKLDQLLKLKADPPAELSNVWSHSISKGEGAIINDITVSYSKAPDKDSIDANATLFGIGTYLLRLTIECVVQDMRNYRKSDHTRCILPASTMMGACSDTCLFIDTKAEEEWMKNKQNKKKLFAYIATKERVHALFSKERIIDFIKTLSMAPVPIDTAE